MKNNKYIDSINKSKKLNLSQKRALIGLVSFWLSKQKIYASYKYLANAWGISEKSVQRAIKHFEKNLKIIEVNRKNGNTNKIKLIVSITELIEVLKNPENNLPIELNQGQVDNITQLDNLGQTISSLIQNDLEPRLNDHNHGQFTPITTDNLTHNKDYYLEYNKEKNKDYYKEHSYILQLEKIEEYLDSQIDFSSWENCNEVAEYIEIPLNNIYSTNKYFTNREENKSSTSINFGIDELIEVPINRSISIDPTSILLQPNNISTEELIEIDVDKQIESNSSIINEYMKELGDGQPNYIKVLLVFDEKTKYPIEVVKVEETGKYLLKSTIDDRLSISR